jgi:DNA-binding NarL/FixJ family response regulator
VGKETVFTRTGPAMMRENQANPRIKSLCATHLRRICGVCEHFAGAMRAEVGRCLKFGDLSAGLQDAAACQSWTRRSAPYVPAEGETALRRRTLRDVERQAQARRDNILALVAQGKSRGDIIAAMGISSTTMSDDMRAMGLRASKRNGPLVRCQ